MRTGELGSHSSAAESVRDLHEVIVYYHSEVIGGHAIGFRAIPHRRREPVLKLDITRIMSESNGLVFRAYGYGAGTPSSSNVSVSSSVREAGCCAFPFSHCDHIAEKDWKLF